MTKKQRRRGPRGDISAPDLLAAAERVLRGGGLAALTLRAVAREADVTPTALYTYFDDMADLRHRLGDAFLAGLDLALLREREPEEGLRLFLHHVLAVFRSSPGHVELLAAQRIAGPHSLALNEALLGFFTDRMGHTPRRAAALTGFATEWVHGTLLLSADASSPGFRRALSRMDPADFPRTAAVPPFDGDEEGVRLLVAAATAG
ncbi:TetR/AcrR family transcriptional regulator [Nocardiopsis flavescens]|uniref:Regulatory protein, tetR family n=1 Tax=Nocardiopsis flavescens TaxID=758803 RepID=A0A1M6UCQ2_9ACTN|nr:TetR/AcrR family transcriptional regulator [Nocardiopsis flavescens]SHK66943.1 regulatory protein, tetR family [Nocardiopsis flavescens]